VENKTDITQLEHTEKYHYVPAATSIQLGCMTTTRMPKTSSELCRKLPQIAPNYAENHLEPILNYAEKTHVKNTRFSNRKIPN